MKIFIISVVVVGVIVDIVIKQNVTFFRLTLFALLFAVGLRKHFGRCDCPSGRGFGRGLHGQTRFTVLVLH